MYVYCIPDVWLNLKTIRILDIHVTHVLVHCVKSVRAYYVKSLTSLFSDNIQWNFKISFRCERFFFQLGYNLIIEIWDCQKWTCSDPCHKTEEKQARKSHTGCIYLTFITVRFQMCPQQVCIKTFSFTYFHLYEGKIVNIFPNHIKILKFSLTFVKQKLNKS